MSTPNRNRGSGSQNNNQDLQPPASAPSTPPTPQNHDFVLMAIMEMKRDLGAISANVSTLLSNQQRSDARLEKIEESLGNITKINYAASVVLAIIIVLGSFLVNKFWDIASSHIEVNIKSDTNTQK